MESMSLPPDEDVGNVETDVKGPCQSFSVDGDKLETKRTRKQTEKHKEWQQSLYKVNFKDAVTSFNRYAVKTSKLVGHADSVEVLKEYQVLLTSRMSNVDETFDKLNNLCSLDIYSEHYLRLHKVKDDFSELNKAIQDRIHALQDVKFGEKSVRTRISRASSKCSRKSSMSDQKVAAATEAAALRAKFKYLEIESNRKLQLEKCQVEMNIAIAEAKLEAIDKLETEDSVEGKSLTSLPADGMNDYVKDYVNSLPVVEQPNFSSLNVNTCDVANVCPQQSSNPIVTSTLNAAADTFVPQIPAQLTVPGETDTAAVPSVSVLNPIPVVSVGQSDHNRITSVNTNQTQGDQNLLIQGLAEQVLLGRLPIPEPGIFTGDPLTYPRWKNAFEVLIERRNIPEGEKIFYLQKYLGGAAKEAVEGYLLLSADNSAYTEAKQLLDDRYGNKFIIASAFREKLEAWPKIPNRDSVALRKFADFLRQCLTAMSTINNLKVLDDERENHKIIQRLPEWVSFRWGRKVSDYRESHGLFPPFETFVRFMITEANIACDPITSCLPQRSENQMRTPHMSSRLFKKPATSRTVFSVDSRQKTNRNEMVHCMLCEGRHSLDECKTFLRKPLQERKQFVADKELCFGCMRVGHRARYCQNRLTCRICKRLHATAFHGDIPADRQNACAYQNRDSQSLSRETITAASGVSHLGHASTANGDGKCSLILPVWVSHANRPYDEQLVYALLDTQSDTTFILDETLHSLGVQGSSVQLRLSTMTSTDKLVPSQKVTGLQVRGYDLSHIIPLPVTYSREIMPANLSHVPTPDKAKQWPHLEMIADRLIPLKDIHVGLLIGYNCPQALTPREVIPPSQNNEPYGQRTDLGWGIVGIVSPSLLENEDPIGASHSILSKKVLVHSMCTSESVGVVHFSVGKVTVKENMLPCDVTRLMELDFQEHVSSQDGLSFEDNKFLKILSHGVHKVENHYEMPLPFKRGKPKLPNNKSLASYRLEQLKSRFRRDFNYKQDYIGFMQNIITKGDAERVPDSELDKAEGEVWYIPHHGVYHPKKPGKIRVVFDCSARFRGISLNDCLLKGPELTNHLVGVLCRFRQEPIALMCDVEQMFHQFKVNPDHRDYLRFLWWDSDDFDGDVVEYRMKVHLFGAASSPGCANFGLKQTVLDNEQDFDESVATFVRRNFYVDDRLSSVPSVHQAVDLIHASKQLCSRGGLHLHKFMSNSKEVMASIPFADHAKEAKDIDLQRDPLPIERALGVTWCVESDAFQFRIMLMDKPLTRRGVLSTVSSIYDPLGFLSPVVVKGKLILQKLCKDEADWDTPLPNDVEVEWEKWKRDLVHVQTFSVDRCIKPADFGSVHSVELHHFSDASSSGYGQCSFVRLVNAEGQVHCAFVMGKARVAPLKSTTVPRLELTAALVSVRVSNYLNEELDITSIKNVFWTDSRIVLGYISNNSRRFHVYVANRVQQIRDKTDPTQWNYVRSDENPADEGSRGLSAKDFGRSMWIKGPDFLWQQDISHLLNTETEQEILEDDPEVKNSKSAHSHTCMLRTSETSATMLQHLEYFSDWFRAKRALALCSKWMDSLRSSSKGTIKPVVGSVQVGDIHAAEQKILKMLQATAFSEEIDILKSFNTQGEFDDRTLTRARNKAIASTSALFRLDPFLDADGLLRVGGRLKCSSLSDGVKHPVILPKGHHVTQLIMKQCHEDVQHQGRGMTVNEVRTKGYWIINCTSAVSQFISKCVKCRRLRGTVQGQKMADLPVDRMEEAPPFSYCAVDLFGPFYIKEGRKELKRYGVLFTCLGCRAVHIETVSSLSTDSFINSLRRFLSVRGPIRQLRCDNGTNFVGARNELQRNLNSMDPDQIKRFLLRNSCDFFPFKFNVPYASHMGGCWERQIRSVRSVLLTLLIEAGHQLDDESMRTLMGEAAAIVNSRPLAVDNLSDVTSPEALTPNHLLTMKSKVLLPPPGNFVSADVYSFKRWRRVQHLANEFWCRWKKRVPTRPSSTTEVDSSKS